MKHNSFLGDLAALLLQLSGVIYAIAAYRRTSRNKQRIQKIESRATCRVCGRSLTHHAEGCPLSED